ncbi:MAG: tetratricopeptide repeat protein [Armatimonadetes bacterium]|nr:MAG: tetratricopeptide repeat protein [Armatimonadota bacterium]
MMSRLILALWLLVALPLSGAAKPLLMIYQVREATFSETDPNLIVDQALAEELSIVGKVKAVLWNKEDPTIREAIRVGRIRSLPQNPSPAEVIQVANAIGCQYVAVVRVTHVGALLDGSLDLYRDGRRIWQATASTAIVRDGAIDKVSTIRSVAATWAAKMNIEPFKELTGIPTDAPVGPPLVTTYATQDAPQAPYDLGRKALDEGRVLEAIVYLRDAVDAEPLDPMRRIALIEALRLAGHPFLAAQEAQRAAELLPSEPKLLAMAAQAWLQGGQIEKAHEMISRVLEREPENAAALGVLADLYVARLDYAKAIEAMNEVIRLQPTAEAFYKRAQIHALKEDFAAAKADLDRAKEMGLPQDEISVNQRYRQYASVLEQLFESLALRIRNLLREAKSGDPSPSLANRAAGLVNVVAAYEQFLDQAEVPESHKRSHATRALAANLLLQSALTAQRFVQEKNEETAAEADLLQVEAMREHALAKQLFAKELGR